MYRPSKTNWLDNINLDQLTQKVSKEVEKTGGELAVAPKFVQFGNGLQEAIAVVEKNQYLYLTILAEHGYKRVNVSKLLNYYLDEAELIKNLTSAACDEQIWLALYNDTIGSAFYQDFDADENSNMMRWLNFVSKNNKGRTIKGDTYWQATVDNMIAHNTYCYGSPESIDIYKFMEQKINNLALEKCVEVNNISESEM